MSSQNRTRSPRRGRSSNSHETEISALQIVYTWDSEAQAVPKTGTVKVELANGSNAVIRDFNPREGTKGLRRKLGPYTGYSQTSFKDALSRMNAHKEIYDQYISDQRLAQRLAEISAGGQGQWTFDDRTYLVVEDERTKPQTKPHDGAGATAPQDGRHAAVATA